MIAATLKSSKATTSKAKACAACPRARRSSASSLRRILRKTARAPRRPLALKNALAAVRPAAAAAKRASPVPAAYVRQALAHTGAGASMYAALQTTRAAPPLPGTLPPTIAISPSTPAAHAPTHMLAVYAPATEGKTHVTLLPAHALVLAAHCTLLPPLPPSTSTAEIPVVPLALPAPGAFPALQAYLYTARADRLCAALLPSLPPTSSPISSASSPSSAPSSAAVPTPAEVAAHLKTTAGCAELEARRALVRGVAADARALGVRDARLWGVLAFAGQALALALA
ncbi:hypothetical protein HWV62_17152 [Athelia sp. TMB]|nr:hypothetical protein HWV62_17152 [Athelia sp. TMB]